MPDALETLKRFIREGLKEGGLQGNKTAIDLAARTLVHQSKPIPKEGQDAHETGGKPK